MCLDNLILTNRIIVAKRSEITLTNKGNKTPCLIDVAIPSNGNIQAKEIEKYTPMAIELKSIWI